MNIPMLARLPLKGLYLSPGVPNTTAVTQETDQDYGPFKTAYRRNLSQLSQERFQQQKNITINDLPLLVFGREETPSQVKLQDAFNDAFKIMNVRRSWIKCGAVPLTRQCLNSPKVRHELAVDRQGNVDQTSDPETKRLLSIEQANAMACDYLNGFGFDGNQLRIKAPRKRKAASLTVPFSKERIEILSKAKTAGQHFHATGGAMLNSTDFFKSKALIQRREEIKSMEAQKKKRQKDYKNQEAARALIAKKGEDLGIHNAEKFNAEDVKVLVRWKMGVVPAQKKGDLVIKYSKAPPPKVALPWTDADEEKLQSLKTDDIQIKDTALAVATQQNARALVNNVAQLDQTHRDALLKALQANDDTGGDIQVGEL